MSARFTKRFLCSEDTRDFPVSIKTVSADAAYDAENILCFIMEGLNAQAIIPRNPRGERTAPYSLKAIASSAPRAAHASQREDDRQKAGITYLQYSCPIHYGKNDSVTFSVRWLIPSSRHRKGATL